LTGKKLQRQGGGEELFTLEVGIISGPITEDFARKNKVISRTIQIRGGQTLEDLHEAIFQAFDRFDEHLYEFQIGGKRPMDPSARRFSLPMVMKSPFGDEEETADATRTAIGSIGLKRKEIFCYWFDFGDDWWHQIEVVSIDETIPKGRFPKVIKKIGKSPPQYPDWD